jgi:hypothetical protein
MVAHASFPSPRSLPVQCGPRRWLDGAFVHVLGADNIIRTEEATAADVEAARWLTWWQSPAGRRFHAYSRVNLGGGRTLRVELAATLQGRFCLLYAVRDCKGRILPGQSVVGAGQDPNEVFDAIISPSLQPDSLPVSWLS